MKSRSLLVPLLVVLPPLSPTGLSPQDMAEAMQQSGPPESATAPVDRGDPQVPQGAPPVPRGAPTDAVELETFVDGLMFVILEELNTAGAVVSVVSGGEVLFAKGYGYSDWETRAPVDPETTLFRIGSVSKLFAWTSVMQLVEQGLLELDTDVNQYLDFEVPPAFGEPVTLGNIMAHAGGFEEFPFGVISEDPEDLRPLGELLADELPARVRPAGDISSYSNHATALAAYVVERTSGTEWTQYVEEQVLGPLGMEYATFRQPLPDHLAPFMSKGYQYRRGRFLEEEFEIVPLAPAGAAAVSATDMARFMIAHLQLGRLGEERILSEETARLMQSDHHRMDPEVNAMAHGFMVYSQNGERIIGHGGDTRLFHTGLWLFPEQDLGLFVSFNSRSSGPARGRIFSAFLDRYFPVPDEIPPIPDDFADRAERFTGAYRANRASFTTFAKIGLLGGTVVRVTDRGTLLVQDTHWIEVEPLVFQEEFGSRRLVFRENPDGEITHFFISSTPIMAWERVPASEGQGLHTVLFILAVATLSLTFLSPLFGWAFRRWYGVQAHELVRIPKGARWTLWSAAFLFILSMVLVVVALEVGDIVRSRGPALAVIFLLPILAAIPTLASVGFAFRMWKTREGRPTVRVLYSVAAISFCLLLWQMSVWNILGWNY